VSITIVYIECVVATDWCIICQFCLKNLTIMLQMVVKVSFDPGHTHVRMVLPLPSHFANITLTKITDSAASVRVWGCTIYYSVQTVDFNLG